MTDPLFKITETQTQGAVRWQKRALAAEAHVAVLQRLLKESQERAMTLSVVADEVLDFLLVYGGGSGNTVCVVEILAHPWYAADQSGEGV